MWKLHQVDRGAFAWVDYVMFSNLSSEICEKVVLCGKTAFFSRRLMDQHREVMKQSASVAIFELPCFNHFIAQTQWCRYPLRTGCFSSSRPSTSWESKLQCCYMVKKHKRMNVVNNIRLSGYGMMLEEFAKPEQTMHLSEQVSTQQFHTSIWSSWQGTLQQISAGGIVERHKYRYRTAINSLRNAPIWMRILSIVMNDRHLLDASWNGNCNRNYK